MAVFLWRSVPLDRFEAVAKLLSPFNDKDEIGMKIFMMTIRYAALVPAIYAAAIFADESKREVRSVEAREAYVLRYPPRVPPVGLGDVTDQAMEAVIAMRQSIDSAPPDELPMSFAIMLNNPGLMVKQVELSAQLHNGELSRRDRELAILRIAWLSQAPYEWGEHVRVAKRVAGLSSEEIDNVTVGSLASGWSEHDRAILRAVEELYSEAMITDETWEILSHTLSRAQLLELPVVVGTYQTIAYMQNSLRFPLRDGNQGLRMR